MTTLLDRYLNAIRASLPKARAGDITAEIADELQSQMDERQGTLGRLLTSDEEAAIIKAYGHPAVVAARYGSVQYLIGPELLPLYWFALRWTAVVVIAIELIAGAAASLATRDGIVFFGALGTAWRSLLWIFAIVTVVFAIAERAPRRDDSRVGPFSLRWDPRRLPPPGIVSPQPRGSTLIEFIANFMMLLVLLDAGGAQRIPLDRIIAAALAAMHASLTPAWHGAYIATIAATAVLAISAIATFVQPRLATLHEGVRGLTSLVVIAGIGLTLTAGPLFAPAGNTLNTPVVAALAIAIVILAAQALASLRALLRIASHRSVTLPAR